MRQLRRARLLARIVLAWFALSIGAAIASPLVKPAALELICSAGGAYKVPLKGNWDGSAARHTLDCPLCAPAAAPPPAVRTDLAFVPARGHALRLAAAARSAAPTAAPLPARGPPASALA